MKNRCYVVCVLSLFFYLMVGHVFAQVCNYDADCDDGLYCNGMETCPGGVCVPGTSPCDDSNPCTTDSCDEASNNCSPKGCAATSLGDTCCNDPVCGGTDICLADVALNPGDVWVVSGETFTTPICLDNPSDLLGGIQFDLCEYVDGQPSDCMNCTDCSLTDRTTLFDCVVLELSNGCCRVILFSTHPAGAIIPGLCDIVKVGYQSHQECLEPTCAVQIPKNIVAVDYGGYQLPAYAYQGGVCFLFADADSDGVSDHEDNCPITPNGPAGGTCLYGTHTGDSCTIAGVNTSECGTGGFCSMDQEDFNDNGIGDVCECENHPECDDGLYCNGDELCWEGECYPGTDPCEPLYCNEEGDTCYSECINDTECDDGLYCNGVETCDGGACVPETPPCDDANPCTTNPCDEFYDTCLDKGCAAVNPSDACCGDPVCGGTDICAAKVTLEPGDGGVASGGTFTTPVCLDNQSFGNYPVRGVQFDLCEYTDSQPTDCMTCMNCALTGRTDEFDCVVNELSNGCCRVILFSPQADSIDPGVCDIVTVDYESHQDCLEPTCTVQIPKNIVAVDEYGYQLPAYGYEGEVCFLSIDTDGDGVPDHEDNCPMTPNGPDGGTCSEGTFRRYPCTIAGYHTSECGLGGFCSMNQEDSNGNGVGDACECENDTECDDGLYCNGNEICTSDDVCVPGTPSCDDSNPCTTDPCDEDNDSCLVKGCAAVSPSDPCCGDPACEGTDICTAKVTLKPEDISVVPGEIFAKSICLDNSLPDILVGGIQFDLCETITDGIPRDCNITCMDCTLTGRTQLFDCVVNELANGCCRVILFSTHPGGLINPGICNIVTVYEFIEDCIGVCLDQIPENIVAVDEYGFQLPAYGLPGEVCFPCIDDDDCEDGIYCNGSETCEGGLCVPGTYPCDDGSECTDDTCYEDIDICTNICNVTSPFDPCCEDPACVGTLICLSEGIINIEDAWANCGDVGVKKDICLQNLDIPIGGFQMDLCEYPVRECSVSGGPCDEDGDCPSEETCDIVEADPDCLICTECEMTERTTMFDCVVNELENGCCRVILFAKHPGGLINPGECNIVRIVYEISDDPSCCDNCIPIDGENIMLADEYGYDVLGLMAYDGKGWICPYVCGDIEPGMSDPESSIYDCGDGDIDIFDILLEVAFALGTDTPDACQEGSRSNVPTGTPPDCLDPDGVINILDIMVLIDMALQRQDCCSYYYMGTIY